MRSVTASWVRLIRRNPIHVERNAHLTRAILENYFKIAISIMGHSQDSCGLETATRAEQLTECQPQIL